MIIHDGWETAEARWRVCVFVRTIREQELSQGNIYVIEVWFYIRKKKEEKRSLRWASGMVVSPFLPRHFRYAGLGSQRRHSSAAEPVAPSRVDAMNGLSVVIKWYRPVPVCSVAAPGLCGPETREQDLLLKQTFLWIIPRAWDLHGLSSDMEPWAILWGWWLVAFYSKKG